MTNILQTVTTRIQRPASKALIIGATFINVTNANLNRPKFEYVDVVCRGSKRLGAERGPQALREARSAVRNA